MRLDVFYTKAGLVAATLFHSEYTLDPPAHSFLAEVSLMHSIAYVNILRSKEDKWEVILLCSYKDVDREVVSVDFRLAYLSSMDEAYRVGVAFCETIPSEYPDLTPIVTGTLDGVMCAKRELVHCRLSHH